MGDKKDKNGEGLGDLGTIAIVTGGAIATVAAAPAAVAAGVAMAAAGSAMLIGRALKGFFGKK